MNTRENRIVSPAAKLLAQWKRLERRPGGKWLFARLLRFGLPYTATVRPEVRIVEPGHAVVAMRDRRLIRNHLNSVHAIALANLGELAGGLAMIATLPPEVRSILTSIRVDYTRKARGTLVAECRCAPPAVTDRMQYDVVSQVTDDAGHVVATITATWLLSPPR